MNFNMPIIDPNMRQRRKSNLGKRHKTGQNLLQVNFGPPAFPKTVLTSLGRSRSAKRTAIMDKASKEYTSGIKKQLFQGSPQIGAILNNIGKTQSKGKRLIFNSSPMGESSNHLNNPAMDITGIGMIGTPSPDCKSTSGSALKSKTANCGAQHWNNMEAKPSQDFKFSVTSSFLEPPRSPGPSLYHQLIMKESIKPPVDKQEGLQLGHLEDRHSLSSLSPAVDLVTSSIKRTSISHLAKAPVISPKLNVCCVSNNEISNSNEEYDRIRMSSNKNKSDQKLDVILEDFYSTESFETAEKKLYDECLEHPIIKNNSTTLTSDSNHNRTLMDSSKNTSHSDEDLVNILEEIEQGLQDMNRLEQRMKSLKMKLQCYLKNQQQSKNNTVIENKENVSLNISKIQNSQWINSLKTENPGLLKTPKLNKSRFSFADQSSIWTPHSLTSVLHDQVEDLFQ